MRIEKGIKIKSGNTVTVANGLRFKKNNVITTVWVANTPFYWVQNSVVQGSYPTKYNMTSLTPSGDYHRNTLTEFYLSGADNSNSNFKGVTDEVDTQRNKYMEVIVSQLTNGGVSKLTILDTEITSAGTYTIDVSGVDGVAIELDLTAYQQSSASANISSIRFYS